MAEKQTEEFVFTIEEGPKVQSPDGSVEVSATTRTDPDGQSLTQVVASHGRGGTGLVAFHAHRVPVAIAWEGNEKLVISYPEDRKPSNLHNTRAGKAVVEYRPVPASEIPPVAWTVALRSRIRTTVEKQARGQIVTIETDGRIRHRYDYADVHEPDSHSEHLRKRGYQGGGPSWLGIVHGLVKLRHPTLLSGLEFDEESDSLSVWSDDENALQTIAALVAEAKTDPALLDAAIEQARKDGQME